MTTTKLEFIQIKSDSLKDIFINDVKKCHKILSTILKNKKYSRTIKINIFQSQIENIYLVMLKGNVDSVLIELGKKYGFPRGFPIIWIPNEYLNFFGFRPKFDNDQRQELVKVDEFDDVESIEFFKKWSGFLGQYIAFQYFDDFYWACVTKNSADKNSSFVQDCERIFLSGIPMIAQFTKAYACENCHICFEVMSKNDQTHGEIVHKEATVVTSIGSGPIYFLNDQSENILINNTFVDFSSLRKTCQDCRFDDLAVGSAFKISGNENVKFFLTYLIRNRDFMTNTKFENFVSNSKKEKKIEVFDGTVTHYEILDDILEGLVLHCTKKDGSTFTKKFKFPNYTVRTMVLRTLIEQYGPSGLVCKEAEEFFQNFVDRWCVSAYGKQYWRNYLKTCAVALYKSYFKIKDGQLKDLLIDIKPYISSRSNKDNKTGIPGLHIVTANEINRIYDNCTNKHVIQEQSDAEYTKICNENTCTTVCIVIGPIAHGKSKFMRELKEMLDIKHNTVQSKVYHDCSGNMIEPEFITIDGDKLDLGTNKVMKLSAERNDYTLSLILKAILNKQIPIISLGGGALFTYGKKPIFRLRELIRKTFGISVFIKLFVAGTETRVEPKEKDITALYTNRFHDNVVEMETRKRLKNGSWFITLNNEEKEKLEKFKDDQVKTDKIMEGITKGFVAKIQKLSRCNMKYAKLLVDHADEVFTFKQITPENYDSVSIPKQFLNFKFEPKRIPTSGCFGQVRLLCETDNETHKNKLRHITVQYDMKNHGIVASVNDFVNIDNELKNNKFPALLYSMTSDDNAKEHWSLIVLTPSNNVDGDNGIHATINSGSHKPGLMLDIAKAINKKQSSISIPNSQGIEIEYDLGKVKTEEANITILKSFAF